VSDDGSAPDPDASDDAAPEESAPDPPDFQGYLAAKRGVDDRALNRRVLDALADRLADRQRVRVVELGAGIGTMLERLLAWELLPDATYTMVDLDAESLATARERLPTWAEDNGYTATWEGGDGDAGADALRLEGPRSVTVRFEVGDAVALAPGFDCDLLVASAFLDLLDAGDYPTLLTALDDGGLFYFPITFDGRTEFAPGHPHDDRVEARFHEHMRRDSSGSEAGRLLFEALPERAELLAAGGSDWVVHPPYEDGEATFLAAILSTVEGALAETPLDAEDAEEWVAERRRQLAGGSLVYVTHQLDVLGRVDGSG
jgi:SAM-dependent methyltransferase